MNILRLAWMEVRLVLTDRMSFFWMLLLPVLMIYFFAKAFPQREAGSKTKVHLEVCNEDGGFLSRSLAEDLREENFEVVLLESLEKRREKGWLRTLIIPKDFTEKVLQGEEVNLFFESEEKASLSGMEAARFNIFRAAGRVLGNLCLIEAGTQGDREPAAGDLEELYRSIASLEPRVSVESSFAGKGRVIPGGYNQTVPGILVMSALIMVMTYGTAQFVMDRRGGMLRRLAAAPCLRWEILAGKLAGRLFTGLIQIGLLLFVSVVFLKFYLGRSLLGWFLCFLPYIFACGALGMLVGTLFRNPDHAATVGWISSVVMSALSGCWWPREIVPGYLNSVGYIFPSAWAMDALHKLISFGGESLSVLPQAAVLWGYFVLFMVLCVRTLRYE